jgi:long-chain acyl-CoA synthetase
MGKSHSKPEIVYSVVNEGGAYVSPIEFKDLKPHNSASTLLESFIISCNHFPNNHFLGSRTIKPDGSLGEYSWKSYKEVYETSKKISFFLKTLFQDPSDLNLLGIISKNREEWILVEFGCFFQSIPTVCLPDSLSLESFHYICKHCWLKVLFCSKPQLELILNYPDMFPSLKTIIVFDKTRNELKSLARSWNIEVIDFHDINFSDFTGEELHPSPSSVFTISYTSGTTSEPKGVVLTHGNMISTVAGAEISRQPLVPNDVYLMYLPHSHIYDRFFFYMIVNLGAKIGIGSGDISNLKDDLQALKPTILVTVPRLLNKIYEGIYAQFNSKTGFTKNILDRALSQKIQKYEQTGELHNNFLQNMAFKKVQKSFGGKLKFMMSGSAPVAGEVMKFLRVVIGTPILEGYGLTETCAGSFTSNSFDVATEHIGGPLPGIEVKLRPVEGYTSNSHSEFGELMIRGPSVFQGYYLVDEQPFIDGWFPTGDLVQRIKSNGCFKVLDRLKNIIKQADGEFVSVEKVERILSSSKYVHQIFVHGESKESFLVAIVVPKSDFFEKRNTRGSFEKKGFHSKLKSEILEDFRKISIKNRMNNWEFVQNLFVEEFEWTDQDLLTLTQKLIRYKAQLKYRQVIDELYCELGNNNV